jgi:hypothetical protein
MIFKKTIYIVLVTSITLFLTFSAWAKDAQTPKYAADVPEFLLTPDKVETDLLGRPRILRWYAQ